MKTLRMAVAALALLAIAIPLRASLPSSDVMYFCTQAVEVKKVMVHLANLDEQPTQIMLMSTFGKVYYKEVIRKHNGHRTLLDLTQLPEGRYILSARRKDETKSQVIRITEGRVLVSHCMN